MSWRKWVGSIRESIFTPSPSHAGKLVVMGHHPKYMDSSQVVVGIVEELDGDILWYQSFRQQCSIWISSSLMVSWDDTSVYIVDEK